MNKNYRIRNKIKKFVLKCRIVIQRNVYYPSEELETISSKAFIIPQKMVLIINSNIFLYILEVRIGD